MHFFNQIMQLRGCTDSDQNPPSGGGGGCGFQPVAVNTGSVINAGEAVESALTGKGGASNRSEDHALKSELNLLSAVAYISGGIIGSGIFITPGSVLLMTHSFGVSMIIWVIGGVIAIFGGLCYTELSLLIRKSGGEYNYLKEAYSFNKKHWTLEVLSSLLAFSYFWSSTFIVRCSSLAIVSLTAGRYMVRPFYIGCDELPENAVVFLALAVLGWYVIFDLCVFISTLKIRPT